MEEQEVMTGLNNALQKVAENDRHLLEFDLSERCIAARLALYLQTEFPELNVDIEYNRDGAAPKRLDLPEACANFQNEDGEALVVPDVIVHKRGHDGPNVLVLELKKTTNREPRDSDRARVRALRERLGYNFGALIECETRQGHEPAINMREWFGAAITILQSTGSMKTIMSFRCGGICERTPSVSLIMVTTSETGIRSCRDWAHY